MLKLLKDCNAHQIVDLMSGCGSSGVVSVEGGQHMTAILIANNEAHQEFMRQHIHQEVAKLQAREGHYLFKSEIVESVQKLFAPLFVAF